MRGTQHLEKLRDNAQHIRVRAVGGVRRSPVARGLEHHSTLGVHDFTLGVYDSTLGV